MIMAINVFGYMVMVGYVLLFNRIFTSVSVSRFFYLLMYESTTSYFDL